MLPTKGLKNTLPYYKYIDWLYPVLQPLFPGMFGTLSDLGLAMIGCMISPPEKRVLEARDIAALAKTVKEPGIHS